MNLEPRQINIDCRFYEGSKPCFWHKNEGAICSRCDRYDKIDANVAIIKLGAMGDVLRTTALLPALKRKYPNSRVTWFAYPESVEILNHITEIDEIVSSFEFSLGSIAYDVVLSLDNGADGIRLASSLCSIARYGFKGDSRGRCVGVYDGCDDTLFQLGLWDDLKRKNKTSYLKMLASLCQLDYRGERAIIELREVERRTGQVAMQCLKRPLVGINVDAGQRWLRKRWNLEYVAQAIPLLTKAGFGVALLGGHDTESWRESTAAGFANNDCVSLKTTNNVRELLGAIANLDVLLTGDTLAMHAAWALSTPVVALFGPTSLHEITLSEADIKLATTELECLSCYLHTCQVAPHCMDLLDPAFVVEAVLKRLTPETMNE